MTGHWAYRQR